MYKFLSKTFKILEKIPVLILIAVIFILYQKNLIHILNSATYIAVALLTCLFHYLYSHFKYLDEKDNSIMRKEFKFYFVVYILLLLTELILDRHLYFINVFNPKNWLNHISSSNLIPFVNTVKFIQGVFQSGNYSYLSLLLGNALLLMPLAFFLPRLFEKFSNFKKFTICAITTTFFIESLQCLTDSGFFDIDDIIINTLGVLLAFFIFNKTFLKKTLNKIFFLSDDKLSKKEMIGSLLIILIVVFLFFISIFGFYIDDPSISIEIFNESETCSGELELLYEDDNYLYYLNNDCIDNTYIKFNNDKYLLKDFLNGKGKKKYHNLFSLERYYSNSKIEIKRESKYFESFVKSKNLSANIDYEINNEIIEIEIYDTLVVENEIFFYYRIKPLSSGECSVHFLIKSIFDDEIQETINKTIVVTEDMEIKIN